MTLSIQKYSGLIGSYHLTRDGESIGAFQYLDDAQRVIDGRYRDWEIDYFRPIADGRDYYLVIQGSSLVCLCREHEHALFIAGHND